MNNEQRLKPDIIDIIQIRTKAEQKICKNGQVTLGKAIFTEACEMFPNIVKPLIATEYDCYYDDNKVEIFLEKLNEKLV